MPEVTLKGGPCDGVVVHVTDGRSVLITDHTDRVARYRPSRDKSVYTFRGYDTIIARLHAPKVAS